MYGSREDNRPDRAKAAFDRIDTDKNGAISLDEFQAGKGGRGPGFMGPGVKRPGPMGPGFKGPGFKGHGPRGAGFAADADQDGKITLDELKATKGPDGNPIPADKAQAFFDRMDTNKDGAITQDDRTAHGRKPAAK